MIEEHNLFFYLGLSVEHVRVVCVFKRIEAYFSPVLWLITEEKVMTFYTNKISKFKRIHDITG